MLYDYILVLNIELRDNLIKLTPKDILWHTYIATYDMSVVIFPTWRVYVVKYVTSKIG